MATDSGLLFLVFGRNWMSWLLPLHSPGFLILTSLPSPWDVGLFFFRAPCLLGRGGCSLPASHRGFTAEPETCCGQVPVVACPHGPVRDGPAVLCGGLSLASIMSFTLQLPPGMCSIWCGGLCLLCNRGLFHREHWEYLR